MKRAAPLAMISTLLLAAAPAPAEEPAWAERALSFRMSQSQAAAVPDQVLIDRGAELFSARFTEIDGAGRPLATQAGIPTHRRRPAPQAFQRLSGPEAASCVACHNDPSPGGAGDFVANAFVSDGFTAAGFDSLDPQFSSERNTTHLFGAGLVELLAREMTAELHAQRAEALARARRTGAPARAELSAKGVGFGALTAMPDGILDVSEVAGVDPDLAIRPFSQKGVVGSLRRFTVGALNAHHGMQAEERFGPRWTGETDFDGDGVAREMRAGDVSALVAWQAALDPPLRETPKDADWAEAAAAGERRFAALGCAECHRPALPLDSLVFTDPAPGEGAGVLRPGDAEPRALDLAGQAWARTLPRDSQGRVLVPLFGDLRRHRIADAQAAHYGNELLAQAFVPRDIFMTAELWGVGSTAPYGHRGDLLTLDAAIRAHGGEARAARDGWEAASEIARSQVIAFLKTLKAPKR